MSLPDIPHAPDLPNDAQVVLERVQQTNATPWILRFFNNFEHELPGGYVRAENIKPSMIDQSPGETGASDFKKSITHRKFFADIDAVLEQHKVDVSKVIRLFKELRKTPSHSDPRVQAEINFNRELVRQMREEGMSDIEIGTIVEIPPSEEEYTQQVNKLWDILRPVYADLRALGYSHYDLTGIMPEQICPTPSPASS